MQRQEPAGLFQAVWQEQGHESDDMQGNGQALKGQQSRQTPHIALQ